MPGLGFADYPAEGTFPVESGAPEHSLQGDPVLSEDDEESSGVGDEISATLLTLLPWGVSILFHVGLVLLAIFTVWTTIKNLQQEEVIIPIAQLNTTTGAPLTMRTTKRLTERSVSRQRTVAKGTHESSTNLTRRVETPSTLIGALGGAASKGSPFGTSLHGGGGLKATMYGNSGNARRIAYLIDASGSLLDSLPFVVNELKRSISELNEQQSFTVIFFQGEEAIEVPPAGLRKATADTKQRVMQWIDIDSGNVNPRGRSDPIPAIKLALKYQPELLFLLSDDITGQAQYETNQKRLLLEIEKANTANTKINTIQFLYPDRLAAAGLKATLQLISETSGGIYKFVDGRELGIQ